ncbi:MAG: CBS domain-containing protein [Nanobdellota archaeon]
MKAMDIPESKKTITVQADQTVSKLIGAMLKSGAEESLVYDGKRLLGLFSHFMALRARTKVSENKVKDYSVPASNLHMKASLLDIARRFLDTETRAMQVSDKHQNKIIDIYGVMQALAETDQKLRIDPQTLHSISDDQGLGKALQYMHKHRLKEMPVVSDDGIIGMLTSKSIMQNYHLEHVQERLRGHVPNAPGKKPHEEKSELLAIPIHNFMEPGKTVIRKNATVQEAANLMVTDEIPLLIVEQEGEYIGILTAENLLRHYVNSFAVETGHIIFQGTESMETVHLANMDKIAEKYAEKMQRWFNNEYELRIHVKEHDLEGKRTRFEVNSRLSYPGTNLAAVGEDWKLITALRKSLEKLENQLRSKYKRQQQKTPFDPVAGEAEEISIAEGLNG